MRHHLFICGLLMLALAASPLAAQSSKAEQLRQAMISCVTRKVEAMDDGISSAEVIGAAVGNRCRAETDAFTGEMDRGSAELVLFRKRTAMREVVVKEATALVLEHRVALKAKNQ